MTIISPVFGASITEKYYTQPYWIYQIEIEYTGDKQFSIFWDGRQVSNLVPDERLDTSKIEVYATSNETILEIFDLGDANNLSADVRILDVAEIRRMSTEETKKAKALGIEDPQDKRIAELEDRVAVLENEKKVLESHNTELLNVNKHLQNQINNLKVQLDNANAIIREQINVIINTLANFKIG